MIIELTDTSSREVASALLDARQRSGGSGGLVLTLLISTDDEHFNDALEAARASATAHPSRVIVVTTVAGDTPRLDATIQIGEGLPGDLLVLRLHGPLVDHGDAICLPLLLPDSPTIAWWPREAPADLRADPIGSLANRRITDAAACPDPQAALLLRARNLAKGDTDLTWTRLTSWRALLAAALDQTEAPVTGARVLAAADNAPATLLTAWLEERLGLTVEQGLGDQPGVNAVVLTTPKGDIAVRRVSGGSATYQTPGQPERTVALRRRPLTDLLTEELERMDADDIFEAAAKRIVAQAEKH